MFLGYENPVLYADVCEEMFQTMDQSTHDSGPWFLTHGSSVSSFKELEAVYYDDRHGIRFVPAKAAQRILAAKYASKHDIAKLVDTRSYADVNKVMGPQSRADIAPTKREATLITTTSSDSIQLVSASIDIDNRPLDFPTLCKEFNSFKRQMNLAMNAIDKLEKRLASDFKKLCFGNMGTAMGDLKSRFPNHTQAICLFKVAPSTSTEKVYRIQSVVVLARFDIEGKSIHDVRVLYKRNVSEGYLKQEPALVAMLNQILSVCSPFNF